MKFDLTYIISTKNRLPLLKILFSRLLPALQPGEEIVVVDACSSDGTAGFLQQLYNEGKIHQFISEADRNQAEGWNKAMLTARGTLIKKLIDDDVFCYKAIGECKKYMLQHPEADVMLSNDLSGNLSNYRLIEQHSRLPYFQQWREGLSPSFTFGDVHMLIRRSALAYIGLYNTGFVMMDWEYSLRISYLKANIVYYTGFNALSVAHSQTVSSKKNMAAITAQGKRAGVFYEYPGDDAAISTWSKVKIAIGKLIYRQKKAGAAVPVADQNLNEIYAHYYNYLLELNSKGSFEFYDGK